MIRINLKINIEKPQWWYKIFRCKHEICSLIENPFTRYGTKTSYMYCIKCGRKAMEISRNCKHEEDSFGRCIYCNERISKHDCDHVGFLTKDPDVNEYWCENCGDWDVEAI